MKRKKIISLLLVLVLLTPLWMYLAWLVSPRHKLVAAIIDKTSYTTEGNGHAAFTWVLDHERYTKNNTQFYSISHDYFGFFPESREKYTIKGLERFSGQQLDQLSGDADMAYITDAYGVYREQWFKKGSPGYYPGLLYGGLSEEDLKYLRLMKAAHKLILAEFNCLGNPTSEDVRDNFEHSFYLHWTGWTGRYFKSLDTTSEDDLPLWIVHFYQAAHQHSWPFSGPGIVLVNSDNRIVVLQAKTDLQDPYPKIVTDSYQRSRFGVPGEVDYPFWFEIVQADTPVNRVVSEFQLPVTETGKQLLRQNGIPETFPAVQMHRNKDYSFFYFSGDFTQYPASIYTAYIKDIEKFRFLFYNHSDELSGREFFWRFYEPMLSNILNQYYQSGKQK